MKKHKWILAILAGSVLVGGIIFCQFACKKETISAKEIKQQFIQDSDSLIPVYNLEQNRKLRFDFALDYSYIENLETDGLEMVSVHTDASCDKESEVMCYVWEEESEGKTTIYVAPIAPAFATESLLDEVQESEAANDLEKAASDRESYWGCAPIYYICLRYDLDSSEPQKLKTPIVIPFTVASESEVPNVIGQVDDLGNLSLAWDAVEGAEYYTIYQNWDDSHWIQKVATTKELSFQDFAAMETAYQNEGIYGSYYVTATVDGKESNLSAAVDTADLRLPYSFAENFQNGVTYESIDEVPTKLQIVNTDGSVMWRPVSYELVPKETGEYVRYDFFVKGTGLKGTVFVKAGEDEELPAMLEFDTNLSYLEKNTHLNKIPSMAIKSVLAQSETEAMGDDEKGVVSLYDTVVEKTAENIAMGETETIQKPPEGCKVFADTAEEAWLAYGLLAAEEEISLQAFPALQNPYVLEDTFLKVCQQNPYVLGVQSYSFDYESLTLKVGYVYSKREISKRQKQIYKEATEIISSIIKEEMTEEERLHAIYLWLEENCMYASVEWEQMKEQEFHKEQSGKEIEDANNAYGALINREALCGGYASACQILSYMAEVKTISVNGYLNGNIPHAWNMVYMDGAWYQLDCSSNRNTTGIPSYLYNADLNLAQARGYVLGQDFVLNWEWELLHKQNRDDRKEYYRAHNLEAATVAEVEWILTKYINEDTIAFRYDGIHLNEEQLVEIVRKVFLKNGKDEQLADLEYRELGEYVVIYKK